MTQPPEPGHPGNDDDSSLPPAPPPAPHGDPVAPTPPPPPPPGGSSALPPPPGGGYEQQQGWQPQYQEQYPAPGQQPAYAGVPQAQPGAPYGIHPGTGIPYSDKSKLVAGLLQIFIAGVGRMYIGQVGLGVAQLLVAIFTCGIGALWSLVDGILILTKDDPRDAQGRILKS